MKIYDHAARPGPDYWHFRCLVCSEPVADHMGLVRGWLMRRRVRRIRAALAERRG